MCTKLKFFIFNQTFTVLKARKQVDDVPIITTSQPENVPQPLLKRSGQRTLVASGNSLALGGELKVFINCKILKSYAVTLKFM